MVNISSYSSKDEELEWLANIDPILLDKGKKEKQLDDIEISSPIEEKRKSNTTTR